MLIQAPNGETRRDFFRTASSALAAVALAGLSGCLVPKVVEKPIDLSEAGWADLEAAVNKYCTIIGMLTFERRRDHHGDGFGSISRTYYYYKLTSKTGTDSPIIEVIEDLDPKKESQLKPGFAEVYGRLSKYEGKYTLHAVSKS